MRLFTNTITSNAFIISCALLIRKSSEPSRRIQKETVKYQPKQNVTLLRPLHYMSLLQKIITTTWTEGYMSCSSICYSLPFTFMHRKETLSKTTYRESKYNRKECNRRNIKPYRIFFSEVCRILEQKVSFFGGGFQVDLLGLEKALTFQGTKKFQGIKQLGLGQ